MASNNRLEVIRGDTCRFQVNVADDSGVPLNITGASVYFTVRKTYSKGIDDTDCIFQKSVGSGITVTNASGGGMSIVILNTDTKDLPAASLLYDLQVVTSGGDVITAALGAFVINPDVTRRAS